MQNLIALAKDEHIYLNEVRQAQKDFALKNNVRSK
jgi:hypothetical protein